MRRARERHVDGRGVVTSPTRPHSSHTPSPRPHVHSCYAQYSIATMDTDDYGLCHPETGKRDGPNNTRVNCSLIDGYPYADSGSGFTWTSAKENFGVPFAPDLDMQVDGMLGSYDGSGFVRDIKPAPDQYAVAPETFDDAIAELKDYLWFDQRTRAAMISFAVYNGNYDMFMSVQFLFEITQAGLVLPQYKFKSLSLDHPWGKLTEAEVSKVVDKDPTTTRLTSSKDGLLYIEGVMYLLVFSFLIRELVDALRVRIKCGTRLGRGGAPPHLTRARRPAVVSRTPPISSSSLCNQQVQDVPVLLQRVGDHRGHEHRLLHLGPRDPHHAHVPADAAQLLHVRKRVPGARAGGVAVRLRTRLGLSSGRHTRPTPPPLLLLLTPLLLPTTGTT